MDNAAPALVHEVNFEVIESLDEFYYSDKFISLVVGPVGSTKTTAGIMKILHHASMMAPDKAGIRKSRCVCVRNTKQQLEDTFIPDFLKWIPNGVMGVYMRTKAKFLIKVADIECEVLFRGLDEKDDVRRLLSLQASFIVFDEFREIHPDIYNAAQGRVGRYPDLVVNGVGCVRDDGTPNAHVWGMTNPPDIDTFWEELLSEPPNNVHVTIQPSGLSPEADWRRFLPPDYYENLAEGKTEDWKAVYIEAQFGRSLSGQPVFPGFDRKAHVADEALSRPLGVKHPLILGVDAGLTPAVVIAHVLPDSRLMVYDVLTAEGMGAFRFINEVVRPHLANKFGGRSHIVVIDPAAGQKAQTDEKTVAQTWRDEKFQVVLAPTNSIAARIKAVEKQLMRQVGGKPGLVLDPEGALPLVQALSGKYRYKINKQGVREEKPEKSHPWSDIADAFQYVCLYVEHGGGMAGGVVLSDSARGVVPVSAEGWT